MIGIYFSGTGNSRYALEVFLQEYDTETKLFSINACPKQAITLLGKRVVEQGTIEKYL